MWDVDRWGMLGSWPWLQDPVAISSLYPPLCLLPNCPAELAQPEGQRAQDALAQGESRLFHSYLGSGYPAHAALPWACLVRHRMYNRLYCSAFVWHVQILGRYNYTLGSSVVAAVVKAHQEDQAEGRATGSLGGVYQRYVHGCMRLTPRSQQICIQCSSLQMLRLQGIYLASDAACDPAPVAGP